MLLILNALAVLLAGPTSGSGEGLRPAALATGEIRFQEARWARGSLPSLTFTVATGRGAPQKVAAFLYYSERPGAFLSSPIAPQFVGVMRVPSSIQVLANHPPMRWPINEFSREAFVQGALFDPDSGLLLAVTNEDYLDIVYDAPPELFALGFETEDDFATPLVNGQDLSTPPEFGALIGLSSMQPPSGPQHRGPAIFDSDPTGPNAGSSDPDLLVGPGNVVILQENLGQSVPGVFDFPDDAVNGGTFVFDFTGFAFIEKVEPRALDLIDVDGLGTGVSVVLTDVLGRRRKFTVPGGWTEDIAAQGPPGFRTLDLTTLAPQPGFRSTATAESHPSFLAGEVVRLEVLLGGSGALDNLVFAVEQDPVFRTSGGQGAQVPPATRDWRVLRR